MKRLVILLVAGAIAGAGCSTGAGGTAEIVGSGSVVADTRQMTGFSQVVVSGGARVLIDAGEVESLTVRTDDNILPLIESAVAGGRLELTIPSEVRPSDEVLITISAIFLEGITVNGSGDVTASALDTQVLTIEINGSGIVTPSGMARRLVLTINGSGAYRGADLVARDGSAVVSGSGEALVQVTETLRAEVSGSGSIRYLGDPSLDESISGSGSVGPG